MKVNIISSDSGWILGKFAAKLHEELLNMGIEASVSDRRRAEADINHHVMFDFVNFAKHPHDTFMITHVDQNWRIRLLADRLNKCGMGICMSEDTMNKLVAWGLPRNKLCYINPAHDHVIKPRKYVVGITHRCHDEVDFRKREGMLLDIVRNIDSDYFKFIIMGDGWDAIVEEMRKIGIETDYYNRFDYDKYIEIMPTLDYYLYFGMDEGSMGYLDALAAGVETIVTPQGFHLDAKGCITYSCEVIDDYIKVFDEISQKRKKLVASVEDWTWENFAKKHVEVWNYLLGTCEMADLYKNRGFYKDGIFSVLPEDYSVHSFLVNEIQNHDYKRIMKRVVRRTKEEIGSLSEKDKGMGNQQNGIS